MRAVFDLYANSVMVSRELAEFTEVAKRAMLSDGVFSVGNCFPYNGRTVIHRSTREGIAYQVTFLDDKGPSGHSDQQSLDSAIKRAFEDVPRREKGRLGVLMSIKAEIQVGARLQGDELTEDDVGVWLTPEEEGFGPVLAIDVGKRCFVVDDIFSMENNGQRDARRGPPPETLTDRLLRAGSSISTVYVETDS